MPDYLIGGSPAIKRIRASLIKLSADSSPLIIIGEPGVGKSLLSSRIHAHSFFNDHKLETVNFKILSERDQRVRLLGGSPPELPSTRRSILELPTTVVLKHIDFASRFLQEQLVEAIPKREITRLGTNQNRSIRCRLIFILNDRPQKLCKTGSMISGLSKILAKYKSIYMPTLKERKEDILVLAQHFFTQFQIQRRKQIDRNFIDLLQSRKWKENVLELKSYIKTFELPPDEVTIQQKDRIEMAKMNLMIDEGKGFSLKSSVLRLEGEVAKRALKKYNGCQTETAQALGMSDFNLHRIIKSTH